MTTPEVAGRFTATHRVPAAGSPTWPTPNPTADNSPPIPAGLRIEVVEQHDDGWTRVRCDNGWEAWVDGRLLTPIASRSSALVLLGVAGVLIGGLLPWVEVGNNSVTAWEMPFEFLLGRENDLGGPKVGLFLLIVLIALIPTVSHQVLPWYAYVSLGAVAVEAVALTVLRVRALTIAPTVGIGALLALVGGVLLAVEGGLAATRK